MKLLAVIMGSDSSLEKRGCASCTAFWPSSGPSSIINCCKLCGLCLRYMFQVEYGFKKDMQNWDVTEIIYFHIMLDYSIKL